MTDPSRRDYMRVAWQFIARKPFRNDPSRRVRCDWRSLVPKVSLVECHLMPFQDTQVFLLKCNGRMMLLLLLDVTDCVPHLRNSDAERPISLLPGKVSQFRKHLVDPDR